MKILDGNIKKKGFISALVASTFLIVSASMAGAHQPINEFQDTTTHFSSVQKFIEHVDKTGYTALLEPAYIHGSNPYDSRNEEVSIFWNTKERSLAADKIFKDFYNYSNLEDAYNSSAAYFEGPQERSFYGAYQDRAVIVINKNFKQVLRDTTAPLLRSKELLKAFPDLFPDYDSLVSAMATFVKHYGSYIIVHELGHGADYQDRFDFLNPGLAKHLEDIAQEMHSDLTAIIHILNKTNISQDNVLPLIDGLIAKRADALFNFNKDHTITPFDTDHASLTGLFILRNMYIEAPELVARVSDYLISDLAADITSNALMPSKAKTLTIAFEAKNVNTLLEYVTFLEDFRLQADNITELAYHISPTHTSTPLLSNKF